MDFLVLIFSITLSALPRLFDENSSMRICLLLIYYALLWSVIVKNMFLPSVFSRKKRSVQKRQYLWILFIVFIGILFIAYLNSYFSSVLAIEEVLKRIFQWTTIILFFFALFLFQDDKDRIDRLKIGLIYAIGLYVLVNASLCLFAGLESSEILYKNPQVCKMLSLIGIDKVRVFFPIATGINSFGTVVGCSLLGSVMIVVMTNIRKSEKIFAILIALSSGYCLMMTDSRGPVVFVLIVLLTVYYFPMKYLRRSSVIILFTPVIPIIIGATLFTLMDTEWASAISRSKTGIPLGSLFGRYNIWCGVGEELSHFSLSHLFGFGVYGQVGSEIGLFAYKGLFDNYLTRIAYMPVHSFCLQYVLDLGYLGLGVLLVLFFLTVRALIQRCESLARSTSGITTIYLALLLYFWLIGFIESAPAVYGREVFIVFLAIFIESVCSPSQEKN